MVRHGCNRGTGSLNLIQFKPTLLISILFHFFTLRRSEYCTDLIPHCIICCFVTWCFCKKSAEFAFPYCCLTPTYCCEDDTISSADIKSLFYFFFLNNLRTEKFPSLKCLCFPYFTQQKIKGHLLYCLLTIQLARKKAYICDQEDPNYHLTCKHDHHIGIHKVLTVAYERFRDICHDARVHLWKSFCFVNSHIKPGPWSFRWKSFGDQEIPERKEKTLL